MDNVIGTNEIGVALGLDSDPQQDALLAAATLWDAAAIDAALAQQMAAQEALYLDPSSAYGVVGAPPPARGAAPPPRQAPPPRGKTGKGGPGMGVPSGKAQALMQTYKRGAANVQGAADNAKKQGTKTVSVAAAYRPGKPLAVVAGAGVYGIVGIVNDSVLGVTPKKLTPKQIEAVKAHTSAIDRTRAAAMEATKAGNRAIAAGKKAGDVAKRVKPILDAAGKGGKPGIHGIIIGLYDACGVDGVLGIDAWGLSPGQLGYDPTTDPDSPLYAGGYSGGPIIGFEADPTLYTPERWGLPPYLPLYTAPVWDKATGIDTSENPDPNLTFVPADNPYTDIGGGNEAPGLQQPLKGGGKLSEADAKVTWDTPPAGAIIWDGSARLPNSLGSYSAFYGPKKGSVGMFGAVWGYTADGWQNGEKKWTLRFGQSNDAFKNDNRDDLGDSDAAAAKAVYQQDPEKHGEDNSGRDKRVIFGPLIGNPNMPGFAGLQYARATGQWFWQAGNAPEEYLHQANATIKDLNAAALKTANDEVNKANKTLREANDVILKTDNATIDALNANTAQLVDEMAEALLKERAAIELQREKDAAADEHTVSELNRRTAEEQQKFDAQLAQQQLEESARASQLETDLARSLQEQEAQQAQFERQYALMQQQTESQYALMQQQMAAQMAPLQMQQDTQMLQMLMQQPQPQMQQSQMDALLLQMLLQQQGGFDPSQGGFDQPQQGFDPNAYYAGFEALQEPQQGGFDPAQLPGSFDMSAYW